MALPKTFISGGEFDSHFVKWNRSKRSGVPKIGEAKVVMRPRIWAKLTFLNSVLRGSKDLTHHHLECVFAQAIFQSFTQLVVDVHAHFVGSEFDFHAVIQLDLQL